MSIKSVTMETGLDLEDEIFGSETGVREDFEYSFEVHKINKCKTTLDGISLPPVDGIDILNMMIFESDYNLSENAINGKAIKFIVSKINLKDIGGCINPSYYEYFKILMDCDYSTINMTKYLNTTSPYKEKGNVVDIAYDSLRKVQKLLQLYYIAKFGRDEHYKEMFFHRPLWSKATEIREKETQRQFDVREYNKAVAEYESYRKELRNKISDNNVKIIINNLKTNAPENKKIRDKIVTTISRADSCYRVLNTNSIDVYKKRRKLLEAYFKKADLLATYDTREYHSCKNKLLKATKLDIKDIKPLTRFTFLEMSYSTLASDFANAAYLTEEELSSEQKEKCKENATRIIKSFLKENLSMREITDQEIEDKVNEYDQYIDKMIRFLNAMYGKEIYTIRA